MILFWPEFFAKVSVFLDYFPGPVLFVLGGLFTAAVVLFIVSLVAKIWELIPTN